MRVQDRIPGAGRNGTGAGLVRGTEGGPVAKSGSGSIATGLDHANDPTAQDSDHGLENHLGSEHVGTNQVEQATMAGILRSRIDVAFGHHRPYAEVMTTMTTTAAV